MASNVVTFQLKLSFYFSNTFIIIDFIVICPIRPSVQFIWNKQIINFSNEDINLLYLQADYFSFINLFPVLLIPAAIIGVADATIGIVSFLTYLYIYFNISSILKKQVF
jgi:hypothetical protein